MFVVPDFIFSSSAFINVNYPASVLVDFDELIEPGIYVLVIPAVADDK